MPSVSKKEIRYLSYKSACNPRETQIEYNNTFNEISQLLLLVVVSTYLKVFTYVSSNFYDPVCSELFVFLWKTMKRQRAVVTGVIVTLWNTTMQRRTSFFLSGRL